MNERCLKGNWNEIKGKLKQKYADLAFPEGKEAKLLARVFNV
jgi:hypothetical protein